MASASEIHLSVETPVAFRVPAITLESTQTATSLLQKNHDLFDIFFNNLGFHNHTAHHVLTAWALGARDPQLRRAYMDSAQIQRPINLARGQRELIDMSNSKEFLNCLGGAEYFEDYLRFFERQLQRRNIKDTLAEFLFSNSEIAKNMFPRLFASFLHPLIHLGFGLEFRQPAIIAEALAMTAVHIDDVGAVMYDTETISRGKIAKSMIDILHEIGNDEIVLGNPCWKDGSPTKDEKFLRAPEALKQLAAQWHVDPEYIAEKTAELINVNVYFTAAAQSPPKKEKFDFFFIHNTNCSIFFTDFLTQPSLNADQKALLLEWKGRYDLIAYGARGAPRLHLVEIQNYKPKFPGPWEDIFRRVNDFDDDSHLSKLIRALANGERVCEPYELKHPERFPIKAQMWLNIAHMAIDSVQNETYFNRWIRGAGYTEQWEKFPDRI